MIRNALHQEVCPYCFDFCVSGGVESAKAQIDGPSLVPCSPSTGCVTDGTNQWQAPMPPKLTDEELRLYDQCKVQTVAAGLTAVAGGLAWLGAVGQLGAAGIGPCKEVHDKYQERVGRGE